jgi:hypothetical protein
LWYFSEASCGEVILSMCLRYRGVLGVVKGY